MGVDQFYCLFFLIKFSYNRHSMCSYIVCGWLHVIVELLQTELLDFRAWKIDSHYFYNKVCQLITYRAHLFLKMAESLSFITLYLIYVSYSNHTQITPENIESVLFLWIIFISVSPIKHYFGKISYQHFSNNKVLWKINNNLSIKGHSSQEDENQWRSCHWRHWMMS